MDDSTPKPQVRLEPEATSDKSTVGDVSSSTNLKDPEDIGNAVYLHERRQLLNAFRFGLVVLLLFASFSILRVMVDLGVLSATAETIVFVVDQFAFPIFLIIAVAFVYIYLPTLATTFRSSTLKEERSVYSESAPPSKEVLETGEATSGLRLRPHSLPEKLTPKDREKLIGEARLLIEQRITGQLLEESITKITRLRLDEDIQQMRQKSLIRLGNQVEVLGSRANSSLRFGMIFAVLGLVALYFSFFSFGSPLTTAIGEEPPSASNQTILHFVEQYLPRFTLVVIVEIVAFFFLRLYARTLTELRYVQNETTNIEAKMIALSAAIRQGHEPSIIGVISALSSTERNGILSKDQTTIEIELERAKNEEGIGTINAVSSLLHGNEKGWFWKKRE